VYAAAGVALLRHARPTLGHPYWLTLPGLHHRGDRAAAI